MHYIILYYIILYYIILYYITGILVSVLQYFYHWLWPCMNIGAEIIQSCDDMSQFYSTSHTYSSWILITLHLLIVKLCISTVMYKYDISNHYNNSIMLCGILQCNMLLYFIIVHCIVSYYIVLYYSIFCFITLYYVASYYVIL